ncbi:hypothetical protein K503DRAFT_702238 [Rhizopogon vinicolor AM-OR11-026]|uniref:Integrase zinc-binding domain-containing protein n=1 Tax=Rhizopogon vinicolor AM-OR11-026 TaxID=1314800 RepID=A0A1B7MIA5_9AGAM|nr:hypothetical protein K503DRAFT_702238 [Rhizopogon vinicolor AM-OR11-026]
MLTDDVKLYLKTCHKCQVRQTIKLHIPPTVPIPGGLFRKAHIVLKSCGLSPFFIVHGVEPLFPFDLTEAAFLLPFPDHDEFSTTDLISWRTRQLQKRTNNLELMEAKVLKARYNSIKHFEATHKITDHNFAPGDLVLVRNSRIEAELSRKMKPRYLGPLVVLRRTIGGSYLLAELDGAVSKLRFAAFQLIPYYPRNRLRISVTSITGFDDVGLDHMASEDMEELDNEESDQDS